MSKFENVKTFATAAIIELDEKGSATTTIETVEIPYTRKLDKAAEYVREVKKLEANVMVAVSALHHEKPERKNYNIGKIVDNASGIYETKEEAEKAAKKLKDESSVFEVPEYEYKSYVWFINNKNGAYTTTEYVCSSCNAYTKANMRAFIALKAEEENNCKILGIHNATREEKEKHFAVIENAKLVNCESKKRS